MTEFEGASIWAFDIFCLGSKPPHLCVCLCVCMCVSVAQSWPTLDDPMDYSPPGSSVHGDSPGKNTGVSCHSLHLGILPTQESNPGLLY